MREKGSWSSTVFTAAASEARARGSVTHLGEQRASEGKGLDSLVDPKAFGGIRLAQNYLVPQGDGFVLESGLAMPVKTDLDTTGSMGGNIELAFASLPKLLGMLSKSAGAVLKRYHTQIATGVVQDRADQFPYEISQFEPDNEIDRQMGLLVPERAGNDATEDYDLGIFATASMTRTDIVKYGLKGYYFSVGDEKGRGVLDRALLAQVFGNENLPAQIPTTTATLSKPLLDGWHAFFLQVGTNPATREWWSRILGPERVVALPRTEDLAEVQACIIGLTEGVLDLQSAADFLVAGSGIARDAAERVVRACAGIPIGAQAALPNFNHVPLAGARFATRDDLWPIGTGGGAAGASASSKPAAPPNDGITWH